MTTPSDLGYHRQFTLGTTRYTAAGLAFKRGVEFQDDTLDIRLDAAPPLLVGGALAARVNWRGRLYEVRNVQRDAASGFATLHAAARADAGSISAAIRLALTAWAIPDTGYHTPHLSRWNRLLRISGSPRRATAFGDWLAARISGSNQDYAATIAALNELALTPLYAPNETDLPSDLPRQQVFGGGGWVAIKPITYVQQSTDDPPEPIATPIAPGDIDGGTEAYSPELLRAALSRNLIFRVGFADADDEVYVGGVSGEPVSVGRVASRQEGVVLLEARRLLDAHNAARATLRLSLGDSYNAFAYEPGDAITTPIDVFQTGDDWNVQSVESEYPRLTLELTRRPTITPTQLSQNTPPPFNTLTLTPLAERQAAPPAPAIAYSGNQTGRTFTITATESFAAAPSEARLAIRLRSNNTLLETRKEPFTSGIAIFDAMDLAAREYSATATAVNRWGESAATRSIGFGR